VLPPTKQEIANPYIDKVTDNMSGHYGTRGHFFNLFLRLRAVSVPKTNAMADIELILSLQGPCQCSVNAPKQAKLYFHLPRLGQANKELVATNHTYY
jgi:hypothetical protein